MSTADRHARQGGDPYRSRCNGVPREHTVHLLQIHPRLVHNSTALRRFSACARKGGPHTVPVGNPGGRYSAFNGAVEREAREVVPAISSPSAKAQLPWDLRSQGQLGHEKNEKKITPAGRAGRDPSDKRGRCLPG